MSNINIQNFGLQASVIQKINKVFSNFSQIEKAVIYGSRAIGNYRNGSDIDITLFGDEKLSHNLNSIAAQLDDLLLPYLIDLSIYKDIDNLELIAHINKFGQILYMRQ